MRTCWREQRAWTLSPRLQESCDAKQEVHEGRQYIICLRTQGDYLFCALFGLFRAANVDNDTVRDVMRRLFAAKLLILHHGIVFRYE